MVGSAIVTPTSFKKENFRNHIMLTYDIICILTFLFEVFWRLFRLLMIFKGYFDLCYCLCLFVYFSMNVSGTSLLFWYESWEYNAIVFRQINETREHYIWHFRQIRGLSKICVKWKWSVKYDSEYMYFWSFGD